MSQSFPVEAEVEEVAAVVVEEEVAVEEAVVVVVEDVRLRLKSAKEKTSA